MKCQSAVAGRPIFKIVSSSTCHTEVLPGYSLCDMSSSGEILWGLRFWQKSGLRIFTLMTWQLTSKRQGKEAAKPVKCYTSFLSHYIDQSNHKAHAVSRSWRNRVLLEGTVERSHCRRACGIGNIFEAIFGKTSSNTRNVIIISLFTILEDAVLNLWTHSHTLLGGHPVLNIILKVFSGTVV